MNAIVAIGSLVLASSVVVGCSAPAEPSADSEGAAESELSGIGDGARFVESGDWKLAKVAFVSQGSRTLSETHEGRTRAVVAFDGALPTRAEIDAADGELSVPVTISFRAPGVVGGGVRRIATDARCFTTLLLNVPGWQRGVQCNVIHGEDQRAESWIVKVTYGDDGVLTDFTLLGQHRPSFDQMLRFER